jgi:predicted ATP-grasp superfamily ATP-dependent carboligase
LRRPFDRVAGHVLDGDAVAEERVLIVGVSTRAFAESARRAGRDCVSVDAFGDLDQKARIENVALVRDKGRAYSAAAAVAIGRRLGAGSAAYVANLENHPAAVRRLGTGRRLLGNSPATLVAARDWTQFARTVEEAGGRVPATFAASEARSLSPNRAWLRKPVRGGGGSGVVHFVPGSRLRADEVVQERIDGVLGSISFAADGRRARLLGLSKGLAGDAAFGARGYRYCGSLYPFPAEPSLLERLDGLAQAMTKAFGLVGVNGLDFIVRDGEAFALELNPRYSASMELLERAGRPNVFEAHADACDGSLAVTPSRTPATSVFGKAIVWARQDVMVGDTRRWLSRDDVRDLPFPGELIRRGHPICTVFAEGPDHAACYGRLVSAATQVEREIGQEAPRANS